MNRIKVSFDFDGTLEFPHIQAIAKRCVNIPQLEVWIVTTRYDNNTRTDPEKNDEVFQVAKEVGILKKHIHFTNMHWKYEFLKEQRFVVHIDDIGKELELIFRGGYKLSEVGRTYPIAIDALRGDCEYRYMQAICKFISEFRGVPYNTKMSPEYFIYEHIEKP